MRDIKFEFLVKDIDRGWCKETFPLFDIERGYSAKWIVDNLFRFNPASGGVIRRQFTGLLDKNGERSAMTAAELKIELSNDTALAPLISGSKASGSGGAGGKRFFGGWVSVVAFSERA